MLVLTLLPGCCFFGLNFCRLLSSQVLFSATGETGSACLPPLPSCPVLARSPWFWFWWKASEAAASNFFHLWAFGRPRFRPRSLFVTPAVSSPSCYEKLWPVVKLVMGLGKRFKSLQCFHNHSGAGVTVTVQLSCDFFTTAMSGGFILTAMWPHRKRFENIKHSCFY